MKILKFTLLVVSFAYATSAWASFYHYNQYALELSPDDANFATLSKKEPSKGFVVSGTLDTEKTSNYFGVFDFVLENKTDKWMVIKDLRVSFLTPAQNQYVSIPVGAQYSSWAQGMQNMEDYNQKKIAVISSIVGGAVLAASDNKRDQSVAAVTTAVSLAALSTMKDYNQIYADLPPYHLLKGDIIIPPGLFMKRWLLVNSTKHKETGYIHTMVLDFKDQDGVAKRFYLQFRPGSERVTGEWQTNDFKVESNKATQNIYFVE